MTECEDPVTGEGDARLRAVVELAQAMAAAHTPRDSAHAAAQGVRQALGGSFAAISKWERELGKLRVLVNVGELAVDEEEFPDDESYPVHEFPEIVGFLHEQWVGGGEPSAWVETAEEPHDGPVSAAAAQRRDEVAGEGAPTRSGWPHCAVAAGAAVWSRRSCCTAGRGASCMSRGGRASRSSAGRMPISRACSPR